MATERRAGGDRRKPEAPSSVSVDGLTNGALKHVQGVEDRFDTAIQLMQRALRWLMGAVAGIGAGAVGGAFALGVYVTNLERDISSRPSDSEVVRMVDSVRIAQDAKTTALGEALNNTTTSLDVLVERSEATRERVARLEGFHP